MSDETRVSAKAALERAGLIKTATGEGTPPPLAQDTGGGQSPAEGTPKPAEGASKVERPVFDTLPGDPPPARKDDVPTAPVIDESKLTQGEIKATRQMREHIKTLEQQLREAKASRDDGEVKTLKEQLVAMQDKLSEYDLTADPRFQEAFEKPKAELIGNIRAIFEEFGVEANAVQELVGKDFKSQIAWLKENGSDTIGAVTPLLHQLNRIETERASKLQNKQLAKEELVRRHAEQERAVMEQSFNLAFQSVAEQGDFLFKEVPGNDVFNANVQKLRSYAKHLAGENTPLSRAMLAAQAASGQIYRDLFAKEQAKRIALEKQFTAIGKSLPRTGGSGIPDNSESRPKGPMSADEVARRVASRM